MYFQSSRCLTLSFQKGFISLRFSCLNPGVLVHVLFFFFFLLTYKHVRNASFHLLGQDLNLSTVPVLFLKAMFLKIAVASVSAWVPSSFHSDVSYSTSTKLCWSWPRQPVIIKTSTNLLLSCPFVISVEFLLFGTPWYKVLIDKRPGMVYILTGGVGLMCLFIIYCAGLFYVNMTHKLAYRKGGSLNCGNASIRSSCKTFP